jgi:AraC family transcriptional regulator
VGRSSSDVSLAPAIHVRDPQIERIGWLMQAEDDAAYPSGRLFADSLAAAFAARLLVVGTRRSAPTSPRGALSTWRLRHVIEYIETHLGEDLALTELAGVAGYSVSHFKTLFTRAVGVPVHRFVLERRVERARTLLLVSDRTVSAVALEVGFAHPSHLARCMRRVLGITPSQLVAGRADRVGRGSRR